MARRESDSTQVSPTISRLSMLASAICMGNVGLLVTFLGNYPVYTIVLFRGIFGTLFLTLFMLRNHSLSRKFLKESLKLHWKPLLISGIVYPFAIYFYFINITISGYAVAAFLLYTAGIFVLLLIFFTRTEKLSKINIISFILAIAGVAIIMEFWEGNIFTMGLLVGILSGFTLSLFVFFKKKIYIAREENKSQLTSEGDFDTFLAWFPTLFVIIIFLPFGLTDVVRLTPIELIFCLLLGFIPTALAFTLYNVGVKNDKGGNIIILSYIEPVVATINTIIFLQAFSVFTMIGGFLIILANIITLKYSKHHDDLEIH
ncbi:MAG: EamA family transporter [Candidatus Lokiarchaeota archaeon]|nr:EamA family transporter [Candidatus Lokiarchaeota archaeon]MBD3341271.1 EamA family transporter [Candidatus Lokiarchaeota archaeon]